MKKMYSVFISSTYEDMREERSAVVSALLGTGQFIPVAMEYFPASDFNTVDYIDTTLNECDYFILILAGKYGSICSNGISYTEKEYDLATEKGVPVLCFVPEDNATKEEYEVCSDDQGKLTAFKKKVNNSHKIMRYLDVQHLQYCVIVSLLQLINSYPARGWVRGDTTQGHDDFNDSVANVKVMKQDMKPMSKEEIEKIVYDAFNSISAKNTPRIYTGKEPPENAREGDIWFQISDEPYNI